MKKVNPTSEETSAAIAAQAPRTIQGEDAPPPAALQSVSAFKSLAKFSRSARLAFGSATQWVKPDMLFRENYKDNLESPPFFITRAFKYKRPATGKDGIGLELAFSNGKMYNVGLGLNEDDSKRTAILRMFQNADGSNIANAEPVGPFCMTKLPTDKGHDYYDLVPYETVQPQSADIDIPFIEIPVDPDIPF